MTIKANREDGSAPFLQITSQEISRNIRSARKSRSWTLADVEAKSNGELKAVVMGSYERGSRSISLSRAILIANVFGMPLHELLGLGNQSVNDQTMKMTLDQRRVNEPEEANQSESQLLLKRYLHAISARRRDWNGEVLSLRASDFDTLTLLLAKNKKELEEWLIDNNFLLNVNQKT
jgi:transcriptional regulator with XRE-family HTH domain